MASGLWKNVSLAGAAGAAGVGHSLPASFLAPLRGRGARASVCICPLSVLLAGSPFEGSESNKKTEAPRDHHDVITGSAGLST